MAQAVEVEHTPGIEAYLGLRYFTVTGEAFPGSPMELACVPPSTLEWLLSHAPTLLEGAETGAGPEDGDLLRSGKLALARLHEFAPRSKKLAALLRNDRSYLLDDRSDSALDRRFVFFCVKAGFSKDEAQAALYAFPFGKGRQHHDADGSRFFDRAYDSALKIIKEKWKPAEAKLVAAPSDLPLVKVFPVSALETNRLS